MTLLDGLLRRRPTSTEHIVGMLGPELRQLSALCLAVGQDLRERGAMRVGVSSVDTQADALLEVRRTRSALADGGALSQGTLSRAGAPYTPGRKN